MTIKERFDKYENEFGFFDRVTCKLASRADVHAFLLIDKLCPSTSKRSERLLFLSPDDEVSFNIKDDKLFDRITDELIIELIRCGVQYDEDNFCLCMPY